MSEIKPTLMTTQEWETLVYAGNLGRDGFVILPNHTTEDVIRHLVATKGLEAVQICIGRLAGDYSF